MFELVSDYKPTGDQPKAIEYLSNGIKEGKKFQTLLGVTGSRKNFHNIDLCYFVWKTKIGDLKQKNSCKAFFLYKLLLKKSRKNGENLCSN